MPRRTPRNKSRTPVCTRTVVLASIILLSGACLAVFIVVHHRLGLGEVLSSAALKELPAFQATLRVAEETLNYPPALSKETSSLPVPELSQSSKTKSPDINQSSPPFREAPGEEGPGSHNILRFKPNDVSSERLVREEIRQLPRPSLASVLAEAAGVKKKSEQQQGGGGGGGVRLTCNGVEHKTLDDFTRTAAPAWLNASKLSRGCDTLAACMWFHCSHRCYDDDTSQSRPAMAKERAAGQGSGDGQSRGGSGGRRSSSRHTQRRLLGKARSAMAGRKGPAATADSLGAALAAFDQKGTIEVSAPSGGAMVVSTSSQKSRPIRLAPPTTTVRRRRKQEQEQEQGSSHGRLLGGSGGGGGGGGRNKERERGGEKERESGGGGGGGGGVWTAPQHVIATLTSLPTRLKHTKATIDSLREQSIPPKVIVVAVPAVSGREGEAEYTIPSFLTTTPGVCVLRTPHDWGPATKLVGLASALFQQGLILSDVDHVDHVHVDVDVDHVKSRHRSPHRHTKSSISNSNSNNDGMRTRQANSSSSSSSSSSLSHHHPNPPHPLRKLRLVVVDDDTWYPPRTIEALLRWSMRLPKAAVGQHGWVPSSKLVYAGNLKNDAPLHYWGRHLSEPRPVTVLTGNTAYMVQPRHLDPLFWKGLLNNHKGDKSEGDGDGGDGGGSGRASGGGSSDGGGGGGQEGTPLSSPPPWEVASTGAKYMDDVWISGHLSRRKVPRFAVPMDKDEPRARWSGGDGPTLENVKGLGRRQMNDQALQAFRGLWDLTRCAPPSTATATSTPAQSMAPSSSSSSSSLSCSGPVQLHYQSPSSSPLLSTVSASAARESDNPEALLVHLVQDDDQGL